MFELGKGTYQLTHGTLKNHRWLPCISWVKLSKKISFDLPIKSAQTGVLNPRTITFEDEAMGFDFLAAHFS